MNEKASDGALEDGTPYRLIHHARRLGPSGKALATVVPSFRVAMTEKRPAIDLLGALYTSVWTLPADPQQKHGSGRIDGNRITLAVEDGMTWVFDRDAYNELMSHCAHAVSYEEFRSFVRGTFDRDLDLLRRLVVWHGRTTKGGPDQ